MEHFVGGVASFLTTVSFVPQVIKILRSRDTSSISLVMYFLFCTGVALWFCYGLLLHSWPIIIANAVTFPLTLLILGMKLYNTFKR